MTNDQPTNNQPSTSIPANETVEETPNITLENSLKKTPNTEKEEQTTPNPVVKIPNIQIEKSPFPFNLGVEVAKMKVFVPLIELIKHETYKSQIRKSLNFIENEDSVNLFDDQPKLIFSPDVSGKPVEGGLPPFILALTFMIKSCTMLCLTLGLHTI